MGYISRVYYAVQIKITLENCQHLDTDTFINYSKKKKKKKKLPTGYGYIDQKMYIIIHYKMQCQTNLKINFKHNLS